MTRIFPEHDERIAGDAPVRFGDKDDGGGARQRGAKTAVRYPVRVESGVLDLDQTFEIAGRGAPRGEAAQPLCDQGKVQVSVRARPLARRNTRISPVPPLGACTSTMARTPLICGLGTTKARRTEP